MIKLRSVVFGLLLAMASPLAAFAQCSGQAPASTYCGNPTGALALPGWKPFSGVPFPNIAGGTVVGNRGTTTAAASAITNPILGIPGTSTGQLGLAGATSGTVTILPQAAAGTYNFNLPTGAGTAGQPLLSGGGGASPMTFGTLGAAAGGTGFASYTLGDILYADSTTTLAKLAGNTTTAKQYLSQTGNGAISAAPAWATIDGGDITGAALTKVDDTNVTLTLGGAPATALLRAASLTLGWTGQLGLTRGGTAASLTASNGGIVYSTAAALAILSGTATANQIVMSGSSAAPSWSTATYPATTTVNQLLYSSSANVIAGLATANRGILNTDGSGVPSITPTPTIGVNGGTGGQITFNGSTSGSVALRVAAAAGTGTIFQLPANNGTSTYLLQTDGAGVTSWAAPSSVAVTSVSPGNGLTSTLTATAPGSAITSTGTLSAAQLVNAQTGTSYAILDSDRAKLITANNASAQAYTIAQAGASSAFQAGWYVDIQNNSTVNGVITITPTTSTINGASTFLVYPQQRVRVVSDGTNYQVQRNTAAQIPGTTTNDAANAGNLGQYVVGTCNNVALTSGADANCTSISLTAGDWDVDAVCYMVPAATTTVTQATCQVGTTSGLVETALGQYGRQYVSNNTAVPNTPWSVVMPSWRVSLSATTTYYLNDNTTFGTSTQAIYGIVRARRMR